MDWSTNNSTTIHRHEYDLSQIEIVAVIFIYTFVSILAVGGNLTVLYLIAKFPLLRSPTNFLIANLAVADLSMAVFCIPFSYWPLLVLSYWPFGLAPCKLIFFMQAVTVMCSAYTLVAISCDRFVAVMFPMRRAYRFTGETLLNVVFTLVEAGFSGTKA
uniref:G-protein coupled receptors family 1 profile domain-containing protein n=1 Tax=Romanomermis culicivorax TaxID=13658 RepID=A0A915HF26_ROMCU